MPHVIICHVQRDGLAGSRQPATRQQGVICGFQAPGTHGGCSRRAGDLESSRDKHMPVPGAGGWGRKGPSIRLGLPGAKEKQRERRQEPAGQREAQPLGLEGERRSRQEVAPVQTPPCQPLPWPGKHPQGSRMSEVSAACVRLILSPCDLRLFPAAPSLSLSLCFCVCSLSLPISLSLGFFFLSLCV